jgi:Tol biopolymer transport system component
LEENALVMELVAGSTLSVPQPLETALDYARQIAEALEAAHEKGITHRDLKPGNIMVTPEGVVKVLDFGLASVPSRDGAGDPNSSPTTVAAPTVAGMIMGTAAYMSPEQAAGKAVDKRSDIWSFGVVLYEMLSGRQLFAGETLSHTLADVLRRPIDIADVKAPRPIVELLKRCLDRDLKTRLQAIGEARIAITRYLADPKIGTGIQSEHAEAGVNWVPWVLAAALAFIASVGWYRATRPAPPKPLMRLSVDLGPEAIRGRHATMVLSPDGRRIVFTGRAPGGGTQLFTRMMDQVEAVPIPGTLGAPGTAGATLDPFFSPDGEWVGFFADGMLKKVAVNGGAVVTLGSPLVPSGASWGDDGNIIIGTVKGLERFPAGGGAPQLVASGFALFPDVLPGGQSVLFDSARLGLPLGIEALVFSTGQTKALLPNGYEPLYLPTSRDTGHLVYLQDGTLFAVAFDPRRLEILGTPVPLLQDVSTGFDLGGVGTGQTIFTGNGTLAYLPSLDLETYPVLWLDAAGKTTPLIQKPDAYNTPRFSPDGKWLAYTLRSQGGKTEVWVFDLDRQTPEQLTFTGPGRGELVWAADSRHLIFGDGTALWWIRADGSGQPQRLLGNLANPRPFSLAPTGRLAIAQQNEGLPVIYTVPIDLSDLEHPKARKQEPFLVDPTIVQVAPAFSPDGKFLAYASNESGSNEIFVRPFPGPGGKWKVSQSGGRFPVWSRAAHELLFLGGDDHIMAVDYSAQGDLFRAGKPRVWSPLPVRRMGLRQNFDLSPDGKRVVMFPQSESQESLHFTFLLNFFDEMRRKVPANGK